MKIKNRNLYIGIITILLCLCLSACSSGTKNTKTTESNVKTNTDISKSNTSTSEKKSKTSDDTKIVNEDKDNEIEDMPVQPIMLFSDYSGMNIYYKGVVAGAYGEQFNADWEKAEKYQNYLIKCGYSLDLNNKDKESNLYRGLADEDFIYVIDQGNTMSFLYGEDVRIEGTGQTISSLMGGGGSVIPNPNMPSTNQTSQCPVCHGMGTVICKGCNGLGYIPSIKHSADYGAGSSVYEVKNHCYSCNGKGQSMCTHCGGTGVIH